MFLFRVALAATLVVYLTEGAKKKTLYSLGFPVGNQSSGASVRSLSTNENLLCKVRETIGVELVGLHELIIEDSFVKKYLQLWKHTHRASKLAFGWTASRVCYSTELSEHALCLADQQALLAAAGADEKLAQSAVSKNSDQGDSILPAACADEQLVPDPTSQESNRPDQLLAAAEAKRSLAGRLCRLNGRLLHSWPACAVPCELIAYGMASALDEEGVGEAIDRGWTSITESLSLTTFKYDERLLYELAFVRMERKDDKMSLAWQPIDLMLVFRAVRK